MTVRMPGIVREVSAMLVAKMTFRRWKGLKIFSWSALESRPKSMMSSARAPSRPSSRSRVSRISALAREEDEHIARPALGHDFLHRPRRRLDVGDLARFFKQLVDRGVGHIHWIHASAHFNVAPPKPWRGRPPPPAGRGKGAEGPRPPRARGREDQNEAALMRLVDDDDLIIRKQRISLNFREEHPVGEPF